MSSSTPSKLPASAPTVFELGNRRSLELSRTIPSSGASASSTADVATATPASGRLESARFAMGTNPPSSNGLDAHLIAIGTPAPGSNLTPVASSHASSTANYASASNAANHASASNVAASPEPKTVFLGGAAYVPPGRGVKLAPKPATMPPRPRASIGLAIFFGVLALVIAPLAPIAWMHAAEQLDLVARGARRATGRGLLHAVQGIGIAMTMVAVAATAFGLTVILGRYTR